MAKLSATNLSIERGGRTLYRNLNLTIQSGERWAVLGPNGSGKTTLLLTLAGLLSQKEGDITINEVPVQHFPNRERARQIGILLQEMVSSFPQTVYDYIKASRYPYHHPLSLHRTHPGEENFIHQVIMALSLQDLTRKNIQALSGGEQRRVAIAALVVQSPEIYLLDEPTNHLDLHHQIEALDLLMRNETVVMTTHDINLAMRYCNRALLLFPEQTYLQGEINDVLTTENISKLYQVAMQKLQTDQQTYWLPTGTSLATSQDKYAIKCASEG